MQYNPIFYFQTKHVDRGYENVQPSLKIQLHNIWMCLPMAMSLMSLTVFLKLSDTVWNS